MCIFLHLFAMEISLCKGKHKIPTHQVMIQYVRFSIQYVDRFFFVFFFVWFFLEATFE